MSFKTTVMAAVAAAGFAAMAMADDTVKIMVMDPYARSSTSMSTSGAAFMTLMNHADEDDRLVAVQSDAAERVEIHTHKEDANGVMKMMEVKEGFVVPAGGMHALQRGGDHVMFLGLKDAMEQGEMISLTLTFENAGDVTVEVPVDLTRKPGAMKHDHKTDG